MSAHKVIDLVIQQHVRELADSQRTWHERPEPEVLPERSQAVSQGNSGNALGDLGNLGSPVGRKSSELSNAPGTRRSSFMILSMLIITCFDLTLRFYNILNNMHE